MVKRRMDQPRRLYLTMFISLLLIIALVVLVLSTQLYASFEEVALNQISAVINNELLRMQDSTESMITTAKTLSMQIYYDNYISKLYLYPSLEWTDINSALNQLESYRRIAPQIHSIYLFNNVTDTFYIASDMAADRIYVKEYFYDKEMVGIIDDLHQHPPFTPIPRVITGDLITSTDVHNDVFTFLFYDQFNVKYNVNTAVAVNVYSEWINVVVGTRDTGAAEEVLITDYKGNLIVTNNDYSMLTDISDISYMKKILNGGEQSNYFIDTVNNEKILVNYSFNKALEWYYIKVTPYSEVIAEMTSIKNVTITMGFIILFAGLLLSWFISYRFYIPVSNMNEKLLKLDYDRKKNQHIMKQNFLRNLLLDSESYEVTRLNKRFSEYGIILDVREAILLVLIKVDDYLDFSTKYDSDDRDIFKYGILNISSEIMNRTYLTEGVDIGSDSMLLILNIPNDKSDHAVDMAALEEELILIRTLVEEHLSLSISFTVSTPADTFEDAVLLLNQVKDSSFYRLFYGKGSIIYAGDIALLSEKKYEYPVQKDKQLVDELLKGNEEEAKESYMDIIMDMSQYSSSAINLAFSRLVYSITEAMKTIMSHNENISKLRLPSIVVSLHEFESMEEVNRIFFELFEKVSQEISQKKVHRYDSIANEVKTYVLDNYSELDLSLNMIADHLEMSPTHMGRIFKRITNRTIGEYIIDVRMKKAKELLRDTDYTAKDIAEMVGYANNTYFYKVFRSYFGVTPNEYRKNEKDESMKSYTEENT